MSRSRCGRDHVQHYDAKAILAGLLDTPDAIRLDDPLSIGTVLAMAEQVRAARTERDELADRLTAIRQTVFRHLREPGQRGDLARDVEAEADPHPEPAEVTP